MYIYLYINIGTPEYNQQNSLSVVEETKDHYYIGFTSTQSSEGHNSTTNISSY